MRAFEANNSVPTIEFTTWLELVRHAMHVSPAPSLGFLQNSIISSQSPMTLLALLSILNSKLQSFLAASFVQTKVILINRSADDLI
jgi:hypothetical protein